jgi:hypothetical protein
LIFDSAYRVRAHIAKSLQTRCKAIRNAVKKYNEAAAALLPPRPPLDWTQVSHYSFLDEFELLRDTQNNIQRRPWAQPAIRETMKQYCHVKRAHEEIFRCNIEIRRLFTSIVDENHHFDTVLSQLHLQHSVMLGPVQDFVTRRRAVNDMLLARIYKIFDSTWYTGAKTVGVRKGTLATHNRTPVVPVAEMGELNNEEEIEAAQEVDEEQEEEIGGVIDFVANSSMFI